MNKLIGCLIARLGRQNVSYGNATMSIAMMTMIVNGIVTKTYVMHIVGQTT